MKMETMSDPRASTTSLPTRSYDFDAVAKVVEKYSHEWIGFNPSIVENRDNVLLTDGEGNYGLFEYEEPGVYYGHYLFTARGEETYAIAKKILGFFLTNYDVDVIMGYTPVEHKGAIRLNLLLGLKFHEIVETEAGPHYRVSLNKDDFNE